MIFLDFNSTTPVDPRVAQAMRPFDADCFGNPASSDHQFGVDASISVEAARDLVGEALKCSPREVLFTSGATESNNLAVQGIIRALGSNDAGVSRTVISAIEHPSVLEPARAVSDELVFAPVESNGILSLEEFESIVKKERPSLVCVMAANNETGAIQPITEISAMCQEREIALHVDFVQTLGRLPIDLSELWISTASISGHKAYGPKGVGALFVSSSHPRVNLEPLLHGGGQERGFRSGTLNVPGIVGLGEATRLALEREAEDREKMLNMRKQLIVELEKVTNGAVRLNSPIDQSLCLPQTLNFSLPGVSAAAVIHQLSDRFAVARGSACSTTRTEPSPVLLAQGLSEQEVLESIRVSFGRSTSAEDLQEFVTALDAARSELLRLSAATRV